MEMYNLEWYIIIISIYLDYFYSNTHIIKIFIMMAITRIFPLRLFIRTAQNHLQDIKLSCLKTFPLNSY